MQFNHLVGEQSERPSRAIIRGRTACQSNQMRLGVAVKDCAAQGLAAAAYDSKPRRGPLPPTAFGLGAP